MLPIASNQSISELPQIVSVSARTGAAKDVIMIAGVLQVAPALS